MGRPIIYPDLCVSLPPRLCAPVEDYVLAWAYGHSGQAWNVPFDKRDKATHRFEIADTRGRLALTVPIAHPESHRCLWSDIRISDHGAWWDVHRVALESAYGRTPYFEFLIDRFLPMLTVGVTDRYPLLRDLALGWDAQIRQILGMENGEWKMENGASPLTLDSSPLTLSPYRQIRAHALGFIPSLSILDLIFNLGPEAAIYLNKQCKTNLTN